MHLQTIDEEAPTWWRKALRYVVGFSCGFAWFGAVMVGGFKNVYGESPVIGWLWLLAAAYVAVLSAKLWAHNLNLVYGYVAFKALLVVISGPERLGGSASDLPRTDAAALLVILLASGALATLIAQHHTLKVGPRVCLTLSAMGFAHSIHLTGMVVGSKLVTADWYAIPAILLVGWFLSRQQQEVS